MQIIAADEALKKRLKEAGVFGAGIVVGAGLASLVWAYVMFWR